MAELSIDQIRRFADDAASSYQSGHYRLAYSDAAGAHAKLHATHPNEVHTVGTTAFDLDQRLMLIRIKAASAMGFASPWRIPALRSAHLIAHNSADAVSPHGRRCLAIIGHDGVNVVNRAAERNKNDDEKFPNDL